MKLRHDALYASRRSPVLARNIVSTSQPLAAQAGLRMLLAGGNAADAALASAIALTVVEPPAMGWARTPMPSSGMARNCMG